MLKAHLFTSFSKHTHWIKPKFSTGLFIISWLVMNILHSALPYQSYIKHVWLLSSCSQIRSKEGRNKFMFWNQYMSFCLPRTSLVWPLLCDYWPTPGSDLTHLWLKIFDLLYLWLKEFDSLVAQNVWPTFGSEYLNHVWLKILWFNICFNANNHLVSITRKK